VVLQVLTDPRQMLDDGNAVSLQVGLVADARLHEHLGGVNRAQREHHLGSRTHALDLAVMGELHAGGPVALERHSGHQRTGENGYVGPVHIGENMGAEYGLAVSAAGSHFENRRAALTLHHPTVLTLEGWNPNRAGTFERGGVRSDWIGCGLGRKPARRCRGSRGRGRHASLRCDGRC